MMDARKGNGGMPAEPQDTRFTVRLAVPRPGGWLQWAPVRGRFEERLAAQESPAVIGPHIDGEIRRGRDYVKVKVTVCAMVTAPDVAQALTAALWAFRKAAGDDPAGWDMAGATAEVQPEGLARCLTPRRQVPAALPDDRRSPGPGRISERVTAGALAAAAGIGNPDGRDVDRSVTGVGGLGEGRARGGRDGSGGDERDDEVAHFVLLR
jgi:hypothetical protein